MDTWRSPKPAEHASAEGGKPAVAEPPLMQELGEAYSLLLLSVATHPF